MIKPFKFRWDDLDPNRHIANTSYTRICVDYRMKMLANLGIHQEYLNENQIGPVALNEKQYFISEVDAEEQLYIDLELNGLSKDTKFFELAHNIYGDDGEIVFYTTTLLAILDLNKRKLIEPPAKFLEFLKELKKSDNYRTIKRKELRSENVPYDKSIKIPLN